MCRRAQPYRRDYFRRLGAEAVQQPDVSPNMARTADTYSNFHCFISFTFFFILIRNLQRLPTKAGTRALFRCP